MLLFGELFIWAINHTGDLTGGSEGMAVPPLEIAGFSWQGWQRHAWADERSWLERKVAERNIHVWPAGDAEAGMDEGLGHAAQRPARAREVRRNRSADA